MITLAVDAQNPERDRVAQAAEVWGKGGLVAFPTETVYGLGARGDLPEAMDRLTRVKERPPGESFTLHIADPSQLPGGLLVSESALRLMERFWPGPLTLVLPKASGGTLGVRLPAHPVALALLRAADGPVYATSANPRGAPPPASAEAVASAFGKVIDCLVDGGKAAIGQSSTVVRVEGEGWQILREGLLSREMVARTVARSILFVCTGNSCRSPMARALFEIEAARRLKVPIGDLLFHGLLAESAGTSAVPIGGASHWAGRVVREQGGDLSRHVPTPLTVEMLERCDEIYAMSRFHVERIRSMSKRAGKIVRLLAEEGTEMADPIGGGEAEYRACAEQIDRGVAAILDRCLASPRPREQGREGKRT
jgi:tRNA threonylcarbamoyl adenosine modification protein (Sua5/YciO/YrdC/YwlC family)